VRKMFRLGVIEESLESLDTLEVLKPFFFSQRVDEVQGDSSPVWHINEYHVPDAEITGLLAVLEQQIKQTWYAHAFDDEKLIVIFQRKSFYISRHKDETWNEMIAYGQSVGVEKHYLETIPLQV